MTLVLEIIGYAASVIIAISLMMSSLLKLRLINLVGSTMFSVYGFAIGAIPVGVLNGFIALINIYYLVKMNPVKDYYKILHVRPDNFYLGEFVEFYAADIRKFFPSFQFDPIKNKYSFFVLRNMAAAGVVLARELNSNTLIIGLDYVTPEYRDLKPGKFIYQSQKDLFKKAGYNKLVSYPENKFHEKYLKKMGFAEMQIDNKKMYSLSLE